MIVCEKCGSVDDYDVVPYKSDKTAWCRGCGSYITNIEYDVPKLYIGKYKGTAINEINDLQYLEWVIRDLKFGERTRKAILDQIEKLKRKK